MPVGLGACPFGSSLYGFGVPDAASIPGGVIYRDATDGAVKESRKIDARTRQYVYNEFGRTQGMSGVQQLVFLALSTTINSSALSGFGNPIGLIEVIGANINQRITDAFNVALKDLTARKLISIRGISIDRFNPTGEFITLSWTDLTTGEEQETHL